MILAAKDAKETKMIWRWGSTPYPEYLRITSDCLAFGVLDDRVERVDRVEF